MSDRVPDADSDAEQLALDGLLRAHLGDAAQRRRGQTAPAMQRPGAARRLRAWPAFAGAAIMVLIGVGTWLTWGPSRADQEQVPPTEVSSTGTPQVIAAEDQTTISLGTRTTVRVDGPAEIVHDGSHLELRRGSISVNVVPGSEPVRIATPAGPVEVLGTRFRVQSWHDQTVVETWEGRVRCGETLISGGQAARAIGRSFEPLLIGNPYGDSPGELWHPEVATILASKRFVLEARPHGADRTWWRSTEADRGHWRHPSATEPAFVSGRCTIRLRANERLTVALPPLPSAVVIRAHAVIREGTADLVLGHLGPINLTAKQLQKLPRRTEDVRTGRPAGQQLASTTSLIVVGRQTRNGISHPIWEIEQQVDGTTGRIWAIGPLDEVGLDARTDCVVENVEFSIDTLRLDTAPP